MSLKTKFEKFKEPLQVKNPIPRDLSRTVKFEVDTPRTPTAKQMEGSKHVPTTYSRG